MDNFKFFTTTTESHQRNLFIGGAKATTKEPLTKFNLEFKSFWKFIKEMSEKMWVIKINIFHI